MFFKKESGNGGNMAGKNLTFSRSTNVSERAKTRIEVATTKSQKQRERVDKSNGLGILRS